MTIEIPPTELVREKIASNEKRYDHAKHDPLLIQAAQCWLTLCDKVGDDAARALLNGDNLSVVLLPKQSHFDSENINPAALTVVQVVLDALEREQVDPVIALHASLGLFLCIGGQLGFERTGLHEYMDERLDVMTAPTEPQNLERE